MKVALYARCSTKDKDQNPETQLRLLRQECERLGYEVYREYVDQASALDIKNRVKWRELMADAKKRKFGMVLVYKLDRAFRSITHLHHTLDTWEHYGIQFKSFSDPIDTTTASGRLMLNILGSFAEFEKDLIAERVRAGMDRAKAKGTKSGKPIGRSRVTTRPGFDERFKLVLEQFKQGDLGKRAAARELGIGTATFSRLLEKE